MNETTPAITPAYVWTVASDWRANKDISDQASLYVSPRSFTVALAEGETASILAAVPLVDDIQLRQQPGGKEDTAIVAVHGHYRGVRITIQTSLPAGEADALMVDLRSAVGGAS